MTSLMICYQEKSCLSSVASIAAATFAPASHALMTGKDLSKSTVAGLKELATNTWVARMDKAHAGHEYSHLNINPKISGVPDPHTPLPDALVSAGGAISKFAEVAVPIARVVTVAVATAGILTAVVEDMQNSRTVIGPKTAGAACSLVTGSVGGYGGAAVGSQVGYYAGGAVGAIFGPGGAAVTAGIGSMIGSIIGGAVGGEQTTQFVGC